MCILFEYMVDILYIQCKKTMAWALDQVDSKAQWKQEEVQKQHCKCVWQFRNTDED